MALLEKTASEAEFRREYVDPGKPGVLAGGIAHWPALSRWTPAYLAELLRDKKMDVFTSPDGEFRFEHDPDIPPSRERMSFGAVAAGVTNKTPRDRALYVMQHSIDVDVPELASDIQTPGILANTQTFRFFWFGAAGNVTPVHYDGVNNLFAQVRGRKRFVLYDPRFTEALYPVPASARFSHIGSVDVEKPDYERFPKFRGAEPLECELNPGDLLFLPAFFWHHVRSLDLAVSVTFYWVPRFEQCLTPLCLRHLQMAYIKDRLATVGSPIADHPGGLIGAARQALDLGHADFAPLLAGAALDRFLRSSPAARSKSPRIQSWFTIAESGAAGAASIADVRLMIKEIEDFLEHAADMACAERP